MARTALGHRWVHFIGSFASVVGVFIHFTAMKMISIYRLRFGLFALASSGFLLAQPVYAGRSCEVKSLKVWDIQSAMGLAERTANQLDASNAKVAVLARAGQDLSKYRLRYSHLGLAYKTPDGWRILHKLNTCGTAEASLYLQGLGEFFMDNPYRYEAAWLPLSPSVEEAILRLLNNPSQRSAMHHKPYNMVSYPWATRYQQSNQWALETLAYALDPSIRNRESAQNWLATRNFQPTVLNIPPLTRLGGRVGMANVAFDDHPNDKRFSDRIETVTVESVFWFLSAQGLADRNVRTVF
jgi:hypothetical protein